jgi:hypothetical protein
LSTEESNGMMARYFSIPMKHVIKTNKIVAALIVVIFLATGVFSVALVRRSVEGFAVYPMSLWHFSSRFCCSTYSLDKACFVSIPGSSVH